MAITTERLRIEANSDDAAAAAAKLRAISNARITAASGVAELGADPKKRTLIPDGNNS